MNLCMHVEQRRPGAAVLSKEATNKRRNCNEAQLFHAKLLLQSYLRSRHCCRWLLRQWSCSKPVEGTSWSGWHDEKKTSHWEPKSRSTRLQHLWYEPLQHQQYFAALPGTGSFRIRVVEPKVTTSLHQCVGTFRSIPS